MNQIAAKKKIRYTLGILTVGKRKRWIKKTKPGISFWSEHFHVLAI